VEDYVEEPERGLMNRRVILAALAALLPMRALAQPNQPASAEILYGPVVATCPRGQKYWLIATKAGAFPIPDYNAIVQLPRPQFEAIVMACGEWVLLDGQPNKWNHGLSQWEMAIL
jgi:hypothetical protein